MPRVLFRLCAALLFASPALAGKKKNAPPPPAEPAVEAADFAASGLVPGPEIGCWAAPGVTRSWRVERHDGVTGTAVLAVQSADDQAIVVDVLGELELPEGADPALRKIFEALEHVDVVPRVRWVPSEVSYEIVNLAEVSAANAIAIDAAFALLDPPLPPEVGQAIRTGLVQPEVLQTEWTKQVNLLTQFPCGASVTGTLSYVQDIPNPFGGPPMRGAGEVVFAADGPTFTVVDTLQLDSPQWQATLDEVERAGAIPAEQLAAMRRLSSTTATHSTVDIDTGLATEVVYTKDDVILDQQRAQRTVYTLVSE